jgi:CBS domain containing-hemolysin-like protein
MEELGRVPRAGDTLETRNATLQVEAVAHNSVTSVRITLPQGEGKPGEEVQ